MTTTYSLLSQERRARRRAGMVDEALTHAIAIMTESGVGALSVSEVARRMGIRPPSLYKYFPSLHSMYDALFARAVRDQQSASASAMAAEDPGLDRLMASARAVVRWSVENPALAQLLFWRPVPGFEPTAESFAPSVEEMAVIRAEFAAAIRLGQLAADTDLDEIVALSTIVLSGLISQQLANEPGAAYESGRFSSLTDRALQTLVTAFLPRRTT